MAEEDENFFKVHDFNNDGYIRQEGFVGIIRSFAGVLNAAPETTEKLAEDMSKVGYLFTLNIVTAVSFSIQEFEFYEFLYFEQTVTL